MSLECKTFPNATSARAAINAAKATWSAPAITFVNCTQQVRLLARIGPLQMVTDAIELNNGRFAVIADHPGFKGEFIERGDIKYPDPPGQGQAQVKP